ncbi:hypothetical protein H0B56_02660 [Haloechinothrix sp. YIM 98757]|uniref:DUF7482 domain-containing protein n=1 Tax=Haloechinothrix aidingensis TaxID=2752311 RepID=A0A838A7X0_9PSEU|nr:hypothetical protein [Haloechinothrix aidingensis]MBA0124439.1 hypothetical protein [Haloechinothrix aidingensis]
MTKGWIGVAVIIAVAVLGFGTWWVYGLGQEDMSTSDGGAGMDGMAGEAPRFPPVAAYYEGERVLFAHPESSDPEISELLTDMMGSPVTTVPELAEAPESALGPVYVFTNGVRPDGPRGPLEFQPDVFDTAPGDDGYTPLRRLVLLTWNEDGTSAGPRLLTSAGEVEDAIEAGELSAERTDVVINAPLLTWPAGRR